MLGFSLVAPIFPTYVMDLGASYTLLGLIISIYGAVQLVTQVPAGRLSDRIGRKPLLIAGLFSFALLPPLYIFATSPYQLILIRVFGGAGASMVWPIAMALIIDDVDALHRGRSMGWYNASFYSAMALGPAIGGALYDTFGLEAPFAFWSALGALSIIIVIIRVREPGQRRLSAVTFISTTKQEMIEKPMVLPGYIPTFIAGCGVVMLAGISGGFNITLLPEIAGEAGLSTTMIGLLYLAYGGCNALANIHFGKAADRGRRKLIIVSGSILVMLAFAMLGLSSSLESLISALALLGLGSGMATPAAAAIVADITSPERRGEIFGIFNTARMSGVVIGPMVAGVCTDAQGLGGALLAFILISAGITATTLTLREPGRSKLV